MHSVTVWARSKFNIAKLLWCRMSSSPHKKYILWEFFGRNNMAISNSTLSIMHNNFTKNITCTLIYVVPVHSRVCTDACYQFCNMLTNKFTLSQYSIGDTHFNGTWRLQRHTTVAINISATDISIQQWQYTLWRYLASPTSQDSCDTHVYYSKHLRIYSTSLF